MSDFNATFAPRNKCVLLNTGGTFALCTKAENHHNNSLRRLEKDRRKRARRTRTAGDCGTRHSKNALTSGRDCCR
jgi:hypothetical protein